MALEVVCVGDVNVDILALTPSHPGRGFEVSVARLEVHPGGSAANVAVALKRLGASSGFIGRVGEDAFGKYLVREFRHEGVDISQLQLDKDHTTGVMLIVVAENGEHSTYAFRGANTELNRRSLSESYIHKAKWIHASGYGLLEDPQRSAIMHAIKIAKRFRKTASLDLSVMTVEKAVEKLRAALPLVDILFMNRLEAEMLSGSKSVRNAANYARRLGPKMAVVKLGDKGCYVLSDGKEIYRPAFKVKPIDTTGAGDAFEAAFIYGLLRGWELGYAATFANAAGAIVTTKIGARTALPTVKEVESFIRARKEGRSHA